MRFDWDDRKAQANFAKHHVTFAEAITAFDDPYALRADDAKHSSQEQREWFIGESDRGVLVIIFTVRQPGNVYRIISARHANRKERKQYEISKVLSF